MEIEVLYHHDNFVQSVIYLRLIMVSPIDKQGAYTLYFSSVSFYRAMNYNRFP